MSLFTGENESPIPRRLGRSASAQATLEGRPWQRPNDSSNVGDVVHFWPGQENSAGAKESQRRADRSSSKNSSDGMRALLGQQQASFAGNGSPRVSSARPSQQPSRESSVDLDGHRHRKTDLSSSMTSGDNMRAVLAHQPNFLSSKRVPRISSVRRCRAPSVENSVRGESDSEQGSQAYRNPSPKSEVLTRSQCRAPSVSTSAGHSPRVPRSPSVRSLASNQDSGYNPRAKPGSVASENSRAVSVEARISPASRDHLWRELFHAEAEDQKETRLRGAGKAIGRRGKDSTGIPWRQIPNYDVGGRLCETGDPHAERRTIVKASGMPEKKRSAFAPSLDQSIGVKELLSADVKSPSRTSTPTNENPTDARTAWLDAVRLRTEVKGDQGNRPQGSVTPSTTDDSSSELHWSWKQSRKGNANHDATKDTCPYQRDDSAGFGAKSMRVRSNRSGQQKPSTSRLQGTAVSPNLQAPVQREDMEPSEKVVESRRDWDLAQYKYDRDWDRDEPLDFNHSPQDDSSLAMSANTRGALSRSASCSLTALSVNAKINPVHSVSSRFGEVPNAENRFSGKPRWK